MQEDGEVPPKPLPDLDLSWRQGSRSVLLLRLRPPGTPGKLWDAATAGGTVVQESRFPSAAQRGPQTPSALAADVKRKSGHRGESLPPHSDPDG